MSYKIFVDGSSGTTGLKIHEYLHNREDLEILSITRDEKSNWFNL